MHAMITLAYTSVGSIKPHVFRFDADKLSIRELEWVYACTPTHKNMFTEKVLLEE